MDVEIDYGRDFNTTLATVPTVDLYLDFQSFWYCHVYVLSFAYFSVSFWCFFSAINIKSQYPLQNLILIATSFLVLTGMLRCAFLMLDAYSAYNRLPSSLLAFIFALGFPSITTTLAMTIFATAQQCLKTEPKSFIWLIILFHFCVSITAEIVAVNEESWRLLLQTVTAIFMIWSLGLFLLFANVRKSIHQLDSPVPLNPPIKPATKKKRDRKRYTESGAQTSFILRRPTPVKSKSRSCGAINGNPLSGSGLTIPSSSVVSLDSLESWDQFSLPGSPRGSPILLARPISLPSVATGGPMRRFWTLRPKKRDLRLSSSYVNSIQQHRKLKGLNWRPRKPVDSYGGNSAERETLSGEDGSDLGIHKDQDSTVINYFTSAGGGPAGSSSKQSTGNSHQMNSNESHATTTSASGSSTLRRNSASNAPKSLISSRLWNFIRAHYWALLFYLIYCGMYLYSVFKYPLDIKSQKTAAEVWDWFVFQSFIRTVELLVLICLAYIVARVGALDSCNLRQRELLRI